VPPKKFVTGKDGDRASAIRVPDKGKKRGSAKEGIGTGDKELLKTVLKKGFPRGRRAHREVVLRRIKKGLSEENSGAGPAEDFYRDLLKRKFPSKEKRHGSTCSGRRKSWKTKKVKKNLLLKSCPPNT